MEWDLLNFDKIRNYDYFFPNDNYIILHEKYKRKPKSQDWERSLSRKIIPSSNN